NQVKIRGFRIELGEIESKLLQHENIKEVAVLVKENKDSEKYICAYVVSKKNLEELNLKSYLKETLPEYMVPAYFVKLEKMPLTTNGKLDRKALPEPNLDTILIKYEAPRNESEEILAKIWSEVLGVKNIGINDNFFELGGHSLKATVLISKIRKELNREVPLKELFRLPTIKELSNFIKETEENPYSKIEEVEEKQYYEASSAQKRIYMTQQFDKDITAYNMPIIFELEGEIDKKRIEGTFKKIVARHESLRTYFKTIEDEIVQKIDNIYEFKLIKRKYNGDIDSIINKFIRPFELDKIPLFRLELVESEEKTYLFIDIHHIISDGVSMNILIKEFAALYNGQNLEPLKLQYKDFAVWQNSFLKSEEMKKQKEYWINRFRDEIPVLNLPYDYERPAMQSFEGDIMTFELNKEVAEDLKRFSKQTGTTMHMVLLSAFNIILSKYSGQEDIIIGIPIAGRPHADIQNIMGMFVNMLPLRNKPEKNKKYLDFLKEVKENSLNAYENQSYQFDNLIKKINIKKDSSRNPLFDVMFDMNGIDFYETAFLDRTILKYKNTKNKISKVDLTLSAIENEDILFFNIEYSTKLFSKNFIQLFIKYYIEIIEKILIDPNMLLKDIIESNTTNINSEIDDIFDEEF
ncbi:condensation domain-containing protein, partial [Clostridium sp. UBA6640]|uniref:condensation domain-containing protein n=1 Tax=Clostridium sp. UBA6640 TaxID=1946370 RepID=UPI0025B9DBCC